MRNKSIKRLLGSILLAFESFIVFFATLAGFGLKVADGPVVWAVGLSLSFLLIATPAILGRKGSYAFGWLLQVAIISIGFWLAPMFFVGAIFTCMWAWAMIAGSTIDKAKQAYEREKAAFGQTENVEIFEIDIDKK
jgi:Zn-dependent protease with chaperone function